MTTTATTAVRERPKTSVVNAVESLVSKRLKYGYTLGTNRIRISLQSDTESESRASYMKQEVAVRSSEDQKWIGSGCPDSAHPNVQTAIADEPKNGGPMQRDRGGPSLFPHGGNTY